MPKMKTRKSASKRYKITATGKVKYKKMGLRHILTKKTSKRKRQLRQPGLLAKSELKRISKLMPYG